MTELSETIAAVTALVADYALTRDQMAELLGGAADGGPDGDGRYPVSLPSGSTVLVPSPQRLAMLSGSANGAVTAALAASTGPSLVGRFGSVAALLASPEAAHGQGKSWQAVGTAYVEAPAAAADQHVTTAGGVKLYATPIAEVLTAQSFGIEAANTSAVNSERMGKLLTAANGRRVVMPPGRLKASFDFAGPVNLAGAGQPSVNPARTALEGGTVIEGSITLTPTNGMVSLGDFGVDHGAAAFATGADAIKISAATYDSGRLAVLRNIVGLGRNPTDAFHAILVEGFEHVDIANVVGAMNMYCAAIKSRNVTLNGFRGIRGQNGIILKSDGSGPGSGSLGNVNASGITIEGSAQTAYGVRVLAANASIGSVNIDQVNISSVDIGVVVEAAAGVAISELGVSNVNGKGIRQFGVQTGGAGGIYEAAFTGFRLSELGQYAAQIGNAAFATVRDFYGSLAAGATSKAGECFRVEAPVGGFVGDNIKLVENYGAGAAVPALYLALPRALSRVTNLQCGLLGNPPMKGFNAQSVATTSATIKPLFDLDTMHSLVKVSADAPATIVAIATTLPGGAAVPEGYTVTIQPIGSTLTFAHAAGGAGSLYLDGANVDRTVNQAIRFEWTGYYWARV